MDIVTVLKADHRKVDELFSQLKGASGRALKTKERLFLEVKQALTLHMLAEETILYPRMQDMPDLRKASFEAGEEHRLVKQLLSEVSQLECGSEPWNAKVKVVMDLVTHHVREEEGEVFKKLKSSLSSTTLNEMGAAVVSLKQNAPEPPLTPGRNTAAEMM
jgi:hemerythrin superfamily protein